MQTAASIFVPRDTLPRVRLKNGGAHDLSGISILPCLLLFTHFTEMNRLVFPVVFLRKFTRSACQEYPVKDRYLNKFLRQKKKRTWHDSPMVSFEGTSLIKTNKPSAATLRRTEQLSFILHRYIADMIYGGELGQEILDTGVQISKVRLLPDFTGVNVTWTVIGSYEEDEKTQQILDKNAGRIRGALSQMYIMSRVPKITFVKDRHSAQAGEVERLLSIADMGPAPEESEDAEHLLQGSDSEAEFSDTDDHKGASFDSSHKTNIFGLDRESLMQSVIIAKNKSKDRSFKPVTGDGAPLDLKELSQDQLNKSIQENLRLRKLSKIPRKKTDRSQYNEDPSLYTDKYEDDFEDVDVYYSEDYDKS